MSNYSIKAEKVRPEGYEFPIGLNDDGSTGTNVATSTTGGLQKCIGGDTGNTFHIFANPSGSGTFIPTFEGEVEILCVGGGGAGGGFNFNGNPGGGGGGGGVTFVKNYPVKIGRNYQVVVGAGGSTAGSRPGWNSQPGNLSGENRWAARAQNGANSSFQDPALPVNPDNTTILGGGGGGGASVERPPYINLPDGAPSFGSGGGKADHEVFGSTGGSASWWWIPTSDPVPPAGVNNPAYGSNPYTGHATVHLAVMSSINSNTHSHLDSINPPANPFHPPSDYRSYARIGGTGYAYNFGQRRRFAAGGGGAGQHGGAYGSTTRPQGIGLFPRPHGLDGGSGVHIPEVVEAELGTPGGKGDSVTPFPAGTDYGFFGGGGHGGGDNDATGYGDWAGSTTIRGPGPAPEGTFPWASSYDNGYIGWSGGAGGGGGADQDGNPTTGRLATSHQKNGMANTGGGGASGGNSNVDGNPYAWQVSGAGGSGIVVIKYKTFQKTFNIN